jgi:hypothetical protein
MPKVSAVYAGDFINASQLTPEHISAVIAAVVLESVGNNNPITKLVVDLRTPAGAPWPRRWVLNKRNSLILASAFGDDTDAWINRIIELWSEPTTFDGNPTLGIMVAPAANGAGGSVIVMPAPARRGDLEEVIPF